MTASEFDNEFDILYNNINSAAAPGIDLYEKSVYLTKAQLELVKEYNGVINKYQEGFDGSDKRKVDFKELIKDAKLNIPITGEASSITSNLVSTFFEIPNDVFLIKFEKAILNDDPCNTQIDIIPVQLDEFNINVKNPFKKPYKQLGWRLDYDLTLTSNVEIITSEDILEYHLRYLKFPEPIILVDLLLDPEFAGMGLTINGETAPQTSVLNKEIHPEILDRAVEMAVRDYRENTLQNKVQLNNRNN